MTHRSKGNTNDVLFSEILMVYQLECLDRNTVGSNIARVKGANYCVLHCKKIVVFLLLDELILPLYVPAPLGVSKKVRHRNKAINKSSPINL